MQVIVLCDDDIAYNFDPISMCRKSLESINSKNISIVMDPNPTKETEAMKNELLQRAHCLELNKNEYLAITIVQ